MTVDLELKWTSCDETEQGSKLIWLIPRLGNEELIDRIQIQSQIVMLYY